MFWKQAEVDMMNGCASETGGPRPDPDRAQWRARGGDRRFRVVLGQPEQEKGRAGTAMTEDGKLRDRLAADLDGTFEDVVRTYQDRLFSFALRITGSREDAEEVAQDAFVRAYRALCVYPAERRRALALRPWLYQITLNVARNRLRGKKLRFVSYDQARGGDAASAWEPADAAEDRPDARYERSRERLDIAALVDRLPDRYRAPLLLRYVEGLRLDEVAKVLRQPVGTAKSNVHRAVNALREALTESRRAER